MKPAIYALCAICARLPDNDLVAAECLNLTGGLPDEQGVAVCQRLDLLSRSAYLSLGLRCLAHGATLDELADHVQALQLRSERFRVEFIDLTACAPIGKRQAILRISDVIDAYPDLDHPQTRFLVVVQSGGLWLGQLLAENDRSYQAHDAKPYRTSSSLPSRLCRALLGLVAPPAGSLLDPFCGTGSLLLEAGALGLQAFGLDNNPRMVGMSRRNLAHFGYPAQVELGDALHCQQTADAVVTDLPYGRLLDIDYAALQPILGHLVSLAPVGVYLAGQDLTAPLLRAGYDSVDLLRVRKHHSMSRFVHICRVPGADQTSELQT